MSDTRSELFKIAKKHFKVDNPTEDNIAFLGQHVRVLEENLYQAKLKQYSGKELYEITQSTFGVEKPTIEQINYTMIAVNPSLYLLKHHTVKGHAMTFHVANRDLQKAGGHRPWQQQIVNDPHPDKATIKSRQLGITEMGVGEMINWADVHSYASPKCMYTFPTYRNLDSFVKTRLNPVVGKGYYSTILDHSRDSMKEKFIRNSALIFRTSSSSGSVEGVDIDYLSMDEFDHVNPSALISATESMESSNFKILRRWSTPTVPDYGIHRLYDQSDQNVYAHKCEKCNHYNIMDFEKNIELVDESGIDLLARDVREGTYRFVCQKCRRPLDRWYNGHWIKTRPDAAIGTSGTRGYFISQMNAVWISADNLHKKLLRSQSTQHFHNYVLGMPYQDQALAMSDSDVDTHKREHLPYPVMTGSEYRFISVGIDWGKWNWVVITGMKDDGREEVIRAFHVKRDNMGSNPEGDLQKVMLEIEPYRPNIICADIGYSGSYIGKMMQHFGVHVVYGVNVLSNKKAKGQIDAVWSEAQNTVTVDKLTHNKATISSIKMGRVGFYCEDDINLKLFKQHWKNVVIRDVEDEETKEVYQEITNRGDDHFAQAHVYSHVGMQKLRSPYGHDETEFGYSNVNPY